MVLLMSCCGRLRYFGIEPLLVGLKLSCGPGVIWADRSRGQGDGPLLGLENKGFGGWTLARVCSRVTAIVKYQ